MLEFRKAESSYSPKLEVFLYTHAHELYLSWAEYPFPWARLQSQMKTAHCLPLEEALWSILLVLISSPPWKLSASSLSHCPLVENDILLLQIILFASYTKFVKCFILLATSK